MLSILSFIVGASFGSFVQVIANRLHVAPIIRGRSKCLSCGEALRVSHLIPIVSNLLLRGKCSYCGSVFGYSSLLFEIISGGVFYLLWVRIIDLQGSIMLAFLYALYYITLYITLSVIALYDARHSVLPRKFLWVFLVLSFVMMCIRYYFEPSILVLLGPVVVAFPFAFLYLISSIFFGRPWLGFGDVFMFLGVGAFFGSLLGLTVFMYSVWLGALYGVLTKGISVFSRKKFITIPFVPFIVISFAVVLFTDTDIVSVVNLLVSSL